MILAFPMGTSKLWEKPVIFRTLLGITIFFRDMFKDLLGNPEYYSKFLRRLLPKFYPVSFLYSFHDFLLDFYHITSWHSYVSYKILPEISSWAIPGNLPEVV